MKKAICIKNYRVKNFDKFIIKLEYKEIYEYEIDKRFSNIYYNIVRMKKDTSIFYPIRLTEREFKIYMKDFNEYRIEKLKMLNKKSLS